MEVQLKLFGAFRTLSNKDILVFNLPNNAVLNDLRAAIENLATIEDQTGLIALLPSCRFSKDTDILAKNAPLSAGEYAILPPVSGG
ncbi:MAG: MoaD/ThiS family protein [Alphaproteobacteria bacterium]